MRSIRKPVRHSQSLQMHRFLVLDSWRGISASIVVISHAYFYSHVVYFEYLNPVIAVDFFFVLSGFVISYAYKEKVAKGLSFLGYILVRFGRLYPLHFATLIAILLSVLLQGYLFPGALGLTKHPPFHNDELWNLRTLINHLLLLQAMNLQSGADWNAPSWSISVEFYAYIVYFLAFKTFTRNLALFLFAALVLVASFILIQYTDYSSMIAIADGAFIRCLFSFSAGVMAQILFAEADRRFALVERVKAQASAMSALELGAIALFVLISGRLIPAIYSPLVFSFLILVYAFEAGIVSRFLHLPLFKLLGDISYTIYMVHWIFALNISRVQKYLSEKFPSWPHVDVQTSDGYLVMLGDNKWIGDGLYVVYFCLIVLISYGVFIYYEDPSRNAFRKLARRFR